VRHADATHVQVDFGITSGELFLNITDDGKGFDAAQEYDGNGLLSMKKRAADFGGLLDIKSSAGEGTRVSLRVPVSQGIGLTR
jgi:signal transduction histidine kinase